MRTTITDDRKFLIQSFMKLSNAQLRNFLRSKQLPVSGSKSELQDRIEEAVDNGTIADADLVNVLDAVLPWWKFHTYLYRGPRLIPDEWRTEDAARQHLAAHNLEGLMDANLPLVLPDDLTLSSIEYVQDRRVRIIAVQRRDYTAREQDLDVEEESEDGETILYRAWVERIARVMVIFEWQLRAKEATLQTTELPSGITYEEVRDEFVELTEHWLDFSRFTELTLKKVIAKLHELEEAGTPEARSHGIEYETDQGRRLSGRSSTASESVLGEAVIDESLRQMRGAGNGRKGNFYWPPTIDNDEEVGVGKEIHTIILAVDNRINVKIRTFSDNTEAEMRHVLSRLRTHCK